MDFLSLEHYRCCKCFVAYTNSTKDTMIIDWFSTKTPFPKVFINTYLIQIAKYMIALIQDKDTHPIPKLQYGLDLTNVYIKFSKILQRATPKTVIAQPPASPIPTTVTLPPTDPVRSHRVPTEPIRNPSETTV